MRVSFDRNRTLRAINYTAVAIRVLDYKLPPSIAPTLSCILYRHEVAGLRFRLNEHPSKGITYSPSCLERYVQAILSMNRIFNVELRTLGSNLPQFRGRGGIRNPIIGKMV